MDSSDKIHYNNRDNLKQNFFFSRNRPAALVSSGQMRDAGKNDFFSLFLCSFPSSNSTLNSLVTQTTYKLWTSAKWRQRLESGQGRADAAYPSATVWLGFRAPLLTVPLDLQTVLQNLPCSYQRELPRFPSFTLSSSVVFPLVFMFGVSTFPGRSIWSLSFL